MASISRSFTGRRRAGGGAGLLPPGQYDVGGDFPVLSAGPTPSTGLADWDFLVTGEVANLRRWTWQQFQELPREDVTVDVHCVTKWSKFHTSWSGVSVDTLLNGVDTAAEFVLAFCDYGYTTNLPLEDVTDGKAWVVDRSRGSRWTPSTAGRRGCWCRICTFGSRRSRSAAYGCPASTSPASGSRWATTTTVIRGGNSGTPATELARRRGQRCNVRDGVRGADPPVRRRRVGPAARRRVRCDGRSHRAVRA